MKNTIFLSCVLAIFAASAELAVSDVAIVSRQPWSNAVKVKFNVSGVTTETNAKFAFSAYDGTTKLCDIDTARVSGDIYADVSGSCEVEIDVKDLHPMLTSRGGLKDFRIGVEVAETSPVLYKIINLETAPGSANHIVYLTRADIISGSHAGIPSSLESYEVNPVSGVDSFIWTGVTNNVGTNQRYVNARLVLRRIPAGSFAMGTSGVNVTITKGFWIGVFPLTWGQYCKITGDTWNPGNSRFLPFTHDGETQKVSSYNVMRGESAVWPQTGYRIEPTSVCAKLCDVAGEDGFDLPTEAQWEYACRAGTDGNLYRSESLDDICWYVGNSGGHSMTPGGKLPNAWGLYDMIGNVWERVLDWNGTTVSGGIDPWGPVGNVDNRRLVRGGCHQSGSGNCSCTSRTADGSTVSSGGGAFYGVRIVQNGRW